MKGMYYRRKLVLALLQSFNKGVEKLKLQKLLFLFTQEQEQKCFDFVPYKYGCFSFRANADLHTLCKYNFVSETKKEWQYIESIDFMKTLKLQDEKVLQQIINKFGNKSSDELIKYTYQHYPFYAIKSIIAKDILNKSELKKVEQQKNIHKETVLFTIGYEGVSLESYINRLINNNVKVLCDTRKNAYSMKYGFSKSQLSTACSGVNIQYIHFPEVGIVSDKRQELNTQADYDKLFKEYKQTVLIQQQNKLTEILALLQENKRIALTCFEKNINQCHRKHLAKSISNLKGFNYSIEHI